MLFVPSLILPDTLPSDEAIKSGKETRHDYDPEFWEFRYKLYRYLERVPDDELEARYLGILKNMRAIISRDRHVIPIGTFLSSWYWYRKEHQTRYEFYLRGVELPTEHPEGVLDNLQPNAPARPRHPNAGDLIFRYTATHWAQQMVDNGALRLTPASRYGDSEMNVARKDVECEKTSYMPGQHVRITTLDGREIPVKGNVSKAISAPDYYVLSMSCDWDDSLFDDFESDECVLIHNPKSFTGQLSRAASAQLPGWYFHHNPVEYFDPYEMIPNHGVTAGNSKDFVYAYQREYRFQWMPLNEERTRGYIDLELGPLKYFAHMHGRPT